MKYTFPVIIVLVLLITLTTADAQWTQVNGLYAGRTIEGLAVLGSLTFAATSNGAYRSTDGGATWEQLPGFYSSPQGLTFSSEGTFLLAGGARGGTCVSSDSGRTWRTSTSDLGSCNSMGACGGKLFAAATYGVAVSADTGRTWGSSSSPQTPRFVQTRKLLLVR